MILLIYNDGPLIRSTNFWETDFERDGLIYLSTNARAFRLLLPRQWEPKLPELATGKLVVVSRPRTPERFAMEIMFDDGGADPYCIHLSPPQLDIVPAAEDDGRDDLECTVWTQSRRGTPHQALRRPAAYRIVPHLPWARPWSA